MRPVTHLFAEEVVCNLSQTSTTAMDQKLEASASTEPGMETASRELTGLLVEHLLTVFGLYRRMPEEKAAVQIST